MEDRATPAKVARAAMAAVQDGRRDSWLDLFADDARVEDPVGHLPPLVGRADLTRFWDGAIAALASVKFEVGKE